jgi:hypothetical protein
MATSCISSVVLTREHRDPIYEEIVSVIHLGDDLPIYLTRGEFDTSDRDWLKAVNRKLAACTRLLDDLGWEQQGNRDSYELEVDQDIAQFMEELDRGARGALKDDSVNVSSRERDAAARVGVTFTDEQWAEKLRCRRRLVDVDLDSISAARVVRDAWKAVS